MKAANIWTDVQVQRAIAAISVLDDVRAVQAFRSNVDAECARGRIDLSKAEVLRQACWRRLGEISCRGGEDHLTRRWLQGLALFEALTGKRANRTRPMLARHGAQEAFVRLVSRVSHGVGFEQMVAAGLHHMTAEWIVLESRHLFDADVLARAEQKLAAAGVADRPGLLPQAA